MTEYPPVQVRTYAGRDHAEADRRFQDDANVMATAGYRPSSQGWVGPSWARLVLTPIVLLIAGMAVGALTIGVLYGFGLAAVACVVYILYASSRAKGTLSVTYTRP